MPEKNNTLSIGGIDCVELIAQYGSPLFVYDASVIQQRFKELLSCIEYSRVRLLYACKANTNIAIMSMLKDCGAGLDAVSPGEIFLGLRAGYRPEDILFTGNNINEDDMLFALENGVELNIGSLNQLDMYGQIGPDTDITIRINPDIGAGYHSHCITGGPESKFGIYFDRVEEVREKASQYNLRIRGIHSHIGSGILDTETFLAAMKVIQDTARKFEGIEYIDFGGGIGIPYKPGEQRIPLDEFGRRAGTQFSEFADEYGNELTLVLEPGRYLVGESGYLLAKVTNRKQTPTHIFIGTDTGFNHCIRPMAYGATHQIVNASRMEGEQESVAVCGNLCESGDVFTRNKEGIQEQELTRVEHGDILALLNTGAYCFSMASNYNSRLLPAEVLIENGKSRLIRKRQEPEDLLRGQSLESVMG